MSLVGFQARNHPQQVAKDGAKLHVDDMGTPPEIFDALNERFNFTIDVAASARHITQSYLDTYPKSKTDSCATGQTSECGVTLLIALSSRG